MRRTSSLLAAVAVAGGPGHDLDHAGTLAVQQGFILRADAAMTFGRHVGPAAARAGSVVQCLSPLPHEG